MTEDVPEETFNQLAAELTNLKDTFQDEREKMLGLIHSLEDRGAIAEKNSDVQAQAAIESAKQKVGESQATAEAVARHIDDIKEETKASEDGKISLEAFKQLTEELATLRGTFADEKTKLLETIQTLEARPAARGRAHAMAAHTESASLSAEATSRRTAKTSALAINTETQHLSASANSNSPSSADSSQPPPQISIADPSAVLGGSVRRVSAGSAGDGETETGRVTPIGGAAAHAAHGPHKDGSPNLDASHKKDDGRNSPADLTPAPTLIPTNHAKEGAEGEEGLEGIPRTMSETVREGHAQEGECASGGAEALPRFPTQIAEDGADAAVVEQLTQELNTLRENMAAVEMEAHAREEEALSQVEGLQNDIERLNREAEMATKEKEQLDDQIQKLQNDLDTERVEWNDERDELQEDLARAKDELTAEVQKGSALNAEQLRLVKELEEAREQFDNLQKDHAALQKVNEDAEKIQQENKRIKQNQKKLEARIQDKQQALQHSQQMLQVQQDVAERAKEREKLLDKRLAEAQERFHEHEAHWQQEVEKVKDRMAKQNNKRIEEMAAEYHKQVHREHQQIKQLEKKNRKLQNSVAKVKERYDRQLVEYDELLNRMEELRMEMVKKQRQAELGSSVVDMVDRRDEIQDIMAQARNNALRRHMLVPDSRKQQLQENNGTNGNMHDEPVMHHHKRLSEDNGISDRAGHKAIKKRKNDDMKRKLNEMKRDANKYMAYDEDYDNRANEPPGNHRMTNYGRGNRPTSPSAHPPTHPPPPTSARQAILTGREARSSAEGPLSQGERMRFRPPSPTAGGNLATPDPTGLPHRPRSPGKVLGSSAPMENVRPQPPGVARPPNAPPHAGGGNMFSYNGLQQPPSNKSI
eukprot:TRINITY_DN63920_c0_g1_i1.p1 TRINITY_DN63920_c0_g1~~TRINITY_DN63920_c0_g1_i1.p1  ORF type:complete len:907 (-),score=181.56 TRINITY_DN63920_c0_g1_i1:1059-3677(-)